MPLSSRDKLLVDVRFAPFARRSGGRLTPGKVRFYSSRLLNFLVVLLKAVQLMRTGDRGAATGQCAPARAPAFHLARGTATRHRRALYHCPRTRRAFRRRWRPCCVSVQACVSHTGHLAEANTFLDSQGHHGGLGGACGRRDSLARLDSRSQRSASTLRLRSDVCSR